MPKHIMLQHFENFLNSIDTVIRIGSKVSDLQGIGTEYLVVDGTPIAKFYNGKLVGSQIVQGNNEVTLTCEGSSI